MAKTITPVQKAIDQDEDTYVYSLRISRDLELAIRYLSHRHRRQIREEIIMALEAWLVEHVALLPEELKKVVE